MSNHLNVKTTVEVGPLFRFGKKSFPVKSLFESNVVKITFHEESGRETTINLDGKDENTHFLFAAVTFPPGGGEEARLGISIHGRSDVCADLYYYANEFEPILNNLTADRILRETKEGIIQLARNQRHHQ